MSDTPSDLSPELAARLAQLEDRLKRLEIDMAQLASLRAEPGDAASESTQRDSDEPQPIATNEELEYEVGQNWFARVGILVLAIGGVFLLSLPYPALPKMAPAMAGYVITGGLFAIAYWWQGKFELVANYLRGAGMALLWFATTRLFFFGAIHGGEIDGWLPPTLFTAVVAINLVIAFRRRSPRLMTLALATGYASAIAIGSASAGLTGLIALGALTAATARRMQWSLPVYTTVILGPIAYLNWAVGNPIRGGTLHITTGTIFAPAILIAMVAILAVGMLRQVRYTPDPIFAAVGAALNSAFGYGVFLAHTGLAYPNGLMIAHLIASAVFLGLAVVFWTTATCTASTFFYAMTGYAALSVAIIDATHVPNVFVWLSAESIVVVATAVWFRSRFIVVANFLIYIATVLGYVVLKGPETGISIGMGIVALLSARILNWQQRRLELKTELMRNAYLASAFIIFPYALYHLVLPAYVGIAWVGLAVTYYLLNLIVRSPKYRWMGHATLLLTTGYLVIVGTRKLDAGYLIASFLALGTVLVVVSMTFSGLKQRARNKAPTVSER